VEQVKDIDVADPTTWTDFLEGIALNFFLTKLFQGEELNCPYHKHLACVNYNFLTQYQVSHTLGDED
jgi:hypothetical protein